MLVEIVVTLLCVYDVEKDEMTKRLFVTSDPKVPDGAEIGPDALIVLMVKMLSFAPPNASRAEIGVDSGAPTFEKTISWSLCCQK